MSKRTRNQQRPVYTAKKRKNYYRIEHMQADLKQYHAGLYTLCGRTYTKGIETTNDRKQVECPNCMAILKERHWYCDNCGFIEGEQVTFEENCALCGREIIP